jgi:putative component of membrane protein insertase Oxa1/YidC/SpoIIIJ protein YidD
MSYFGQGLLVALIQGYRRFLSGRGPLRSITCTFASSESCSAYALRVAAHVARNGPEAVRLIRARLHRCRQASLYRFVDGWGWGELYDAWREGAYLPHLTAAAENPATIGSVLWSAALVARHRGDEQGARVLIQQAQKLVEPAMYGVIRDGKNWLRHLRRRLVYRLCCALGLVLVSLLLPAFMSLGCLTAAALGSMAAVQEHRRQQNRFEMQSAANSFRVL